MARDRPGPLALSVSRSLDGYPGVH